jgi:putative ABC transport system ATP-binding protein
MAGMTHPNEKLLSMSASSICLEDVVFAYEDGDFRLKISSLGVDRGEHLAVVGASGSGKTTLLEIIAGIRSVATGVVTVNGLNLSAVSDEGRRKFRVNNVGLIFQSFELLEYLSVRDNILLPYRMTSGLKLTGDAIARAERLATETGIAKQIGSYPGQLSQGERQRAAICRALVIQPSLILADEPTGNLDPSNKQKVLEILLKQAEQHAATLIMVTHDHDLLARFERTLNMDELR